MDLTLLYWVTGWGKESEELYYSSCPQDLEQWFSMVFNLAGLGGGVFRPGGNLAWFGGIFDCRYCEERMATLASGGERPGMLLRLLQPAGPPHAAKNDLDQNINSEKPRSRCNGNSKGLKGSWIIEKEGRVWPDGCTRSTSLKDTQRLMHPPSSKSMKKLV